MLKDKVRERKMRILETRYDTHDNVRILIARRKMRKLIVTLKVSRSKEEVVSSSSSISERRLTTCVGSVSHPCWLPTVYHWLWYVALYTDTTAIVLTSDGHTDPFHVSKGILQGDTLAPFLFVLVVYWMMRRALTPELIAECGICVTPRRSSRNLAYYLSDLDFADDIALLSRNMSTAQKILTAVEKSAILVGLTINKSKTE